MLKEVTHAIGQEKFSNENNNVLGELTKTTVNEKSQNWQFWYIVDPKLNTVNHWTQRLTCAPSDIPEIYSFISSLPITNIFSAWVGYLPAGCCLYPHVDSLAKLKMNTNTGLRGMYIKLNESPGHLMKFAGFGVLPDGDFIINNKDFVHSVINDSDVDRYILNIQFTGDQNQLSQSIQFPK
jgi:hypothetical protein